MKENVEIADVMAAIIELNKKVDMLTKNQTQNFKKPYTKDTFISINWDRNDIKCALKDNKIKSTNKNIALVIKTVSPLLEDTMSGWNLIDYKISELKERGLFE